jgi:hypothetical protein
MLGDVIAREAAARYGDTALYVTPGWARASPTPSSTRVSDRVAAGSGLGRGRAAPATSIGAAAPLGAGLRRGLRRRGQDRGRHRRGERPAVTARAAPLPGDRPAPAGGGIEELAARPPIWRTLDRGRRDRRGATPTLRPVPTCWPQLRRRPATTSRDTPHHPDPDRAVAVVFTSGTTGEPKGAVFG